ncbi:NAD(P)-dependent oxidoreductase [Lentilactobacillus otakiensis]|uniref:NAD(P)-dependent oxidoreductase n=1 Tax=Lentilactobacillus otakiensis TaxID=481720 RepID=UPI003D17546B
MKILDLFNLTEQQQAKLAGLGNVQVIEPQDLNDNNSKEIDAIYGWDAHAEEVLTASPKLKFIQSNSAGVDYMPLSEFQKKGIILANVSGIHAEPISETVIAYVLSFARGIVTTAAARPDKRWVGDQVRMQNYTLKNRTAVIFGTGHIGEAIAEKLQFFGTRTVGVSRHGNPVAHFDEVVTDDEGTDRAAKADFVINIMPLTPATKHFFNKKFFDEMINHPVFINVGRGPSVDTQALINALDQYKLAGAGLDVFESEPLEKSSPLWEMDNVILTPHISGGFQEYGAEAFDILYKNLASFIQTGEVAVNKVDLSAGY